jgi:uncharacterized membrane protein
MDKKNDNISAAIAYIPIIGWLYVFFLHHDNEFAMFHLRQSIGLFLFLLVSMLGWGLVTWVLAWIPYGMLFGVALFTMVIIAFVFGVFAWIIGIVHALQGRVALLPIFGRAANRMQL